MYRAVAGRVFGPMATSPGYVSHGDEVRTGSA